MPDADLVARARERVEYLGLVTSKNVLQRLRRQRPRQFVFVAGMQRSGTNLLMDLIERSFETDVYHERDPRAFDNYRMRELDVIRRLARESFAPFFVIKALCELDQLGSLMDDFAPAKTIWIVREYGDAVNSALASFGNFSKQVARIAKNRNTDDWRAAGMSEQTHEIVLRHYHPDIDDVTSAALIWYLRNVLFFEQSFDRDARVKRVFYEGLVLDPDREARSVFEFLGIPFTSWITRKVFASSIRKRPPPNIDPAVARLCEDLSARFRESISR